MSGKEFSSGITRLDDYVAGFKPDDICSIILAQTETWEELQDAFISEAHTRKIPCVHISLQSSRPKRGEDSKRDRRFEVPAKKIKTSSLIKSIARFVSLHGKGSYVFCGELSLWSERLGSERNILQLVEAIARVSAKNGSLLIVGALRGGLSLQTLSHLWHRTPQTRLSRRARAQNPVAFDTGQIF